MKNTWYVALVLMSLGAALPAHADPCQGHKINPNEQCIGASVSSDPKDFTPLYIELDSSGNLAGLRVGDGTDKVFKNSQLLSGADFKIHGHNGVVVGQAFHLNPSTGATLRLTYDSDIVFWGTKRTIDLGIVKDSSGKWHMTYNGGAVTKLVMTPASRGISSVQAVAILADVRKSVDGATVPVGSGANPAESDQVIAKNVVPGTEGGIDGLSPSEHNDKLPTQVAI